jgi:hypothetical protein
MMNRLMRLLMAITLLSTFSLAGFFLDNGIGLKGIQLGGAYSASPSGPDVVFWNMANGAFATEASVYTSVANLPLDTTDMSIMGIIPLGSVGTAGFAYYRIGVDDIMYTNSSGGSLGSNFGYTNDAALIGISSKISNSFSIGLTGKMIQQKAVESSVDYFVDISAVYRLTELFSFGFVGRNIVGTSTVGENGPQYDIGLSQYIGETLVNLDYSYSTLQKQGFVKAGIRYTGLSLVNLTIGYNGSSDHLAFGATTVLEGMELDYVFSVTDLGSIHRVGVGFIL